MSSPFLSQSKSNKTSKKSSLLIFISSDKNFSSSFIDCKTESELSMREFIDCFVVEVTRSLNGQSKLYESMPSEFILKVMHSVRHSEEGKRRATYEIQ